MPMTYAPSRGELVWLEFTPQKGSEQSGRRPALVVSPHAYNRKVGLGLFCPVTTQIKNWKVVNFLLAIFLNTHVS